MSRIVVSELMWPEGLTILQGEGELIYEPDLWQDPERLAGLLSEAVALVVRNQTRVTAELLGKAPRLRVIGRLGVGLDNIDLVAARGRGVRVVYAKHANAVAVAEYVMAAMLAWTRRLAEASEDVKRGGWRRWHFVGSELYGKTLGLVGAGDIGTRVAVRARAFGMRVLGYDPFVSPYSVEAVELGIKLVGLPEVAVAADFLSVHVPLTPATRLLVNATVLEMMKPTAVLINTARGEVVDEEALYQALAARRISGAVLDVFVQEPPTESPLLSLDNVLLTPHVAGLTQEAQVRTAVLVAQEVVRALRGDSPHPGD